MDVKQVIHSNIKTLFICSRDAQGGIIFKEITALEVELIVL